MKEQLRLKITLKANIFILWEGHIILSELKCLPQRQKINIKKGGYEYDEKSNNENRSSFHFDESQNESESELELSIEEQLDAEDFILLSLKAQ